MQPDQRNMCEKIAQNRRVFLVGIVATFVIIFVVFGAAIGAIIERYNGDMEFDQHYIDTEGLPQDTDVKAYLGDDYEIGKDEYLDNMGFMEKWKVALKGNAAMNGAIGGALSGALLGCTLIRGMKDYYLKNDLSNAAIDDAIFHVTRDFSREVVFDDKAGSKWHDRNSNLKPILKKKGLDNKEERKKVCEYLFNAGKADYKYGKIASKKKIAYGYGISTLLVIGMIIAYYFGVMDPVAAVAIMGTLGVTLIVFTLVAIFGATAVGLCCAAAQRRRMTSHSAIVTGPILILLTLLLAVWFFNKPCYKKSVPVELKQVMVV